MPQQFPSVWFRDRTTRSWPFGLWAAQDVGTLEISTDEARFTGREGVVMVRDVHTISYGRFGLDFINAWARVELDDGRTLMFADGRDLGWRGIFGGTARLFAALAPLQRATPSTGSSTNGRSGRSGRRGG